MNVLFIHFSIFYREPVNESLSKTIKLIILDSLLQEVRIKTDLTCRSPLSSLRMSVSLCQLQTFFIQD